MSHSFDAQYFELFSSSYGAQLAQQISTIDPATYSHCIPTIWLEIVARPTEHSVRALWEPAAAHLPRFVSYVASAIQGAAVINVQGAHVLMLALPEWDGDRLAETPGFCWMGTPTPPHLIEEFVRRVGPIPPSLEGLWRVANFVTTKQPSKICSLDPSARKLAEPPEVLPPCPADDDGQIYECLKIAAVNSEMTTCMVRPPGSHEWADYLAVRYTSSQELSWGVRRQLDNLLVDQSILEW
jgi:hypothetical protein